MSVSPPDDNTGAVRVLGLYDGGDPAPALVEECARLGLDLIPYVECMPFGPRPHLLLGAMNPWRLATGLAADFAGFIEVLPGRPLADRTAWQECVAAAAAGGIGMSLTSGSAYTHDLPPPFVAALGRRFPDAGNLNAVELALYEALANAIIHGNLGIDSALRTSAASLREYRAALAHALADPAKAARRVTVTCTPRNGRLRLIVSDQGTGWDMESLMRSAAAPQAKSGRGLDLIRQVAATMTVEDDGRRLVMEFDRQAP